MAVQMDSTPLQEWAEANDPKKTLIFARGYWDQIVFMRDKLPSTLARNFEEYRAISEGIMVISTHTSKSVRLPVFRIELANGTKFTLRDNFHNWKVSVDSPREVEMEFLRLFNPDAEWPYYYCEGFPRDAVFGAYSKNKRWFTVELGDDYYLFAFFLLFAQWMFGEKQEIEGEVA